ncbi:hypothetical protein [Paraburkholderia sp. BCC1886]|uniref:hypothetical protein n=1 Tax=Paraburkholderia sp. BCC1886 TaxID=2562670 RepID=UPI00118384CA|nr:hypothetical protein [Paraburkholderia sp. BCC1886]
MMQWLSRWKHRRTIQEHRAMSQALRSEAQEQSNFQPNRKLLENLLLHLDVGLFEDYRHSYGAGRAISTLFPKIDLYNAELLKLKAAVARESILGHQWSTIDTQQVPLSQFFTSHDGFYLDVPKELITFKENALILCRLMQSSDTADFGLHEHNLRMLTKLLVNLRQIAVALIDLSEAIET